MHTDPLSSPQVKVGYLCLFMISYRTVVHVMLSRMFSTFVSYHAIVPKARTEAPAAKSHRRLNLILHDQRKLPVVFHLPPRLFHNGNQEFPIRSSYTILIRLVRVVDSMDWSRHEFYAVIA